MVFIVDGNKIGRYRSIIAEDGRLEPEVELTVTLRESGDFELLHLHYYSGNYVKFQSSNPIINNLQKTPLPKRVSFSTMISLMYIQVKFVQFNVDLVTGQSHTPYKHFFTLTLHITRVS